MTNGMILKDEIVRLRLAKGWEQIDLARAAGVKQQTLSLIESGETKNSKFIGPIADALEVSVNQIDTSFSDFAPQSLRRVKHDGMSQGEQSRSFPYYAAAEGGDGAIILSWDAIEYTVAPPELQYVRGAYGMYIIGESMEPRYERGDRVWVNPNIPPSPGDDVLFFQSRDGETTALVKRLVRSSPTDWHVRQFNPAQTFKLPKAVWRHAHLILGRANRKT